MKIDFAPEAARLRLDFAADAALDAFASEVAARDGFLLRLDHEVPLDSAWRVELRAPGRELELRVVAAEKLDTVTGEIAVRFRLAAAGAFEVAAPSPPPAVEASPAAQRPTEPAASEGTSEPDEGEHLGTSPGHRIRELNPSQRSILAMKASRTERQILLRDSSPLVLQSLLANPRLEAKEVLSLVGSTRATASLLQRVAEDGRWGKNREIVTAVARNPKTPTPLAVRLMDRLRTQDLRRMAKMSGGLKEIVRRAALREYLRRTQSR